MLNFDSWTLFNVQRARAGLEVNDNVLPAIFKTNINAFQHQTLYPSGEPAISHCSFLLRTCVSNMLPNLYLKRLAIAKCFSTV